MIKRKRRMHFEEEGRRRKRQFEEEGWRQFENEKLSHERFMVKPFWEWGGVR